MRRRRVSLLGAATAAVGLLSVASLLGADARPPATAKAESQSSVLGTGRQASADAPPRDSNGVPYGVPVRSIDGPGVDRHDDEGAYTGTIDTAKARVGKAKLSVTIPNVTLLSYVKLCVVNAPVNPGDPPFQGCCPDTQDVSTCPADDIITVPATSADDQGVGWAAFVGKVWVASPAGSPFRYGTFPTVRIKLLAFGSVPVTASLHLSQPVGRGSLLKPLQFDQTGMFSPPPVGTRVAGYPVPRPEDAPGNVGYVYSKAFTFGGDLNVRISDVSLDGVPLNVGSRCQTVKPARLEASSPQGWNALDDLASKLRGRPGGFRPIGFSLTTQTGDTGELNGNISIPRFRGCRDGARSLDALVSAIASGPTNGVDTTLKDPIQECDNGGAVRCPEHPTEVVTAPPTPDQRSVKSNASAVASAEVRSLRRLFATMPVDARRRAITLLPKATVRQLGLR